MGTPHSSNLQHYWSITIRLFSVISRTLVGEVLTSFHRCSRYILQPNWLGSQENETHKILLGFDIQTYHPIQIRRLDLVLVDKKERTCQLIDFTVLVNRRVQVKEREKLDKYLDPTRGLKQWSCGAWRW